MRFLMLCFVNDDVFDILGDYVKIIENDRNRLDRLYMDCWYGNYRWIMWCDLWFVKWYDYCI